MTWEENQGVETTKIALVLLRKKVVSKKTRGANKGDGLKGRLGRGGKNRTKRIEASENLGSPTMLKKFQKLS